MTDINGDRPQSLAVLCAVCPEVEAYVSECEDGWLHARINTMQTTQSAGPNLDYQCSVVLNVNVTLKVYHRLVETMTKGQGHVHIR